MKLVTVTAVSVKESNNRIITTPQIIQIYQIQDKTLFCQNEFGSFQTVPLVVKEGAVRLVLWLSWRAAVILHC